MPGIDYNPSRPYQESRATCRARLADEACAWFESVCNVPSAAWSPVDGRRAWMCARHYARAAGLPLD